MTNELIGSVVKSCAETLRVTVTTCGLCKSINLEVWATPSASGDGPGLHPTKEGLTIGADLLPDLMALLEQAGRAAKGEPA